MFPIYILYSVIQRNEKKINLNQLRFYITFFEEPYYSENSVEYQFLVLSESKPFQVKPWHIDTFFNTYACFPIRQKKIRTKMLKMTTLSIRDAGSNLW